MCALLHSGLSCASKLPHKVVCDAETFSVLNNAGKQLLRDGLKDKAVLLVLDDVEDGQAGSLLDIKQLGWSLPPLA
jgi:hypothetical protein